MPTSTIDPDAGIATLINVFTVEPAKQGALVRSLSEATEEVMRHRDGFISANLHASGDGRTVVNYAQWRDAAAFRTMLADPVAREHVEAVLEIATSAPALCEVVATHHV